MRIHFDLTLVQKLFDHSKAATARGATYDQLYEGKFRKDGKDFKPKKGDEKAYPESEDIDETKITAGLWLVGDQGIYLMSNGKPGMLVEPKATPADTDETKIERGPLLVVGQQVIQVSEDMKTIIEEPKLAKNIVAYADEANPEGDFDTWWDAKRAAFGGDDGVEYLEVAFVNALLALGVDGRVCIDISPTSMKVVKPAARPKPKAPKAT